MEQGNFSSIQIKIIKKKNKNNSSTRFSLKRKKKKKKIQQKGELSHNTGPKYSHIHMPIFIFLLEPRTTAELGKSTIILRKWFVMHVETAVVYLAVAAPAVTLAPV